jgi:hypothetical protein
MTVTFRTQQASYVLLTRAVIPEVVNHPAVVEVVGNQPVTLVQVPQVAVADYVGLQISYLQQTPDQCNLTVIESGDAAPSERIDRVARAVFREALAIQSPLALGMNFVQIGTVTDDFVGPRLLSLVEGEGLKRVKTLDVHPDSAGIRLYYDYDLWRVTLSVEPDVTDPRQLVASSNFHVQEPGREAIEELLGVRNEAYGAFVSVLDELLGGRDDVSIP